MRSESIDVSRALILTTTGGGGRTGNAMRVIAHLITRAHACKAIAQFPVTDERNRVFEPTPETRTFDFSERPGLAHPRCSDPKYGGQGGAGNIGYWWKFAPKLPNVSPEEKAFFAQYDPEVGVVQSCVRWYLGLCAEDYCDEVQLTDNSLVMFIRQGDVFKHGFNPDVHPAYGQPPFSYYLSAMTHQKWSEIVVVGKNEPVDISPIWSILSMLKNYRAFRAPIRFQSSQAWNTDFRTLMCAPNIVTAVSSLNHLLQLGWIGNYYSPHECTVEMVQFGRRAFTVTTDGDYGSYVEHTNSPEEWVDVLLHKSLPVEECK
jgi:hypothetical protein